MVKGNRDTEAGVLPSREVVEAIGQFNEQMVKDGVLLAAEGLRASSHGARIQFGGGRRIVIHGPFANANQLIAGFWLIQVRTREEALEWAFRCPAPYGANREGEIEIRQVREAARLAQSD